MADVNPLPPSPPRPLQPAAPQQDQSIPPRPISPPAGLDIKDTNIAHLSPSPAPFSPSPQKPATQTPPPSSAGFKSAIRTMEDDLERIKSSAPSPSKPPSQPQMPPQIPQRPPTQPPRPPATAPIPPPPVRPVTLPPRPITVPPRQNELKTAPSVSIPPSSSGGNRKWLIIALVVIVLGGLAVWFFVFRSSEPKATPTPVPTLIPTATPTPTATPLSFDAIFHPTGTLSYSSLVSKTALSELAASIDQQALSVGELKVFRVTDAQETPRTFGTVATDLKVVMPNAVMATLDPNVFYISLFGKPDGTKGRGIMIKAQDQVKLQSALTAWEPTMPQNMKDLLKLNLAKSASKVFLTNTYQGVPLRYRNFPDALNTLDYATVSSPAGESFLVVTNTRDHMFGIVDRALGIILGK